MEMGTELPDPKNRKEKLKAIRLYSYEQAKKFYDAILRYEKGDTDRTFLQQRDLVFLNKIGDHISFVSKGAAEYHTNEFLDSTKAKQKWDKADQIRLASVLRRKAPWHLESNSSYLLGKCLFAPFSTCLYMKWGNYTTEIVIEPHIKSLFEKFAKQNGWFIEITEQDMFQNSATPLATGYNVLNLRRNTKT